MPSVNDNDHIGICLRLVLSLSTCLFARFVWISKRMMPISDGDPFKIDASARAWRGLISKDRTGTKRFVGPEPMI